MVIVEIERNVTMEEIWCPIKGYEGFYGVSDKGRVRSLKSGKERILKPGSDKDGYLQVGLYKNGEKKMCKVHRLVAQTFIPNPDNLTEVNHKDEDKINNKVSNLEWCDYSYNTNYGTRTKRAKEKRFSDRFVVINLDTGEVYKTPKDASRATGIHNDSISRVCKGKSKTAGGYRWRYLNE